MTTSEIPTATVLALDLGAVDDELDRELAGTVGAYLPPEACKGHFWPRDVPALDALYYVIDELDGAGVWARDGIRGGHVNAYYQRGADGDVLNEAALNVEVWVAPAVSVSTYIDNLRLVLRWSDHQGDTCPPTWRQLAVGLTTLLNHRLADAGRALSA
ncbi:hypothetical protein [Dietzia sp. 179-F 9C3 NHS]|uniref:hypothetical protein n=1 Tax=Dietzia sp. 179-F 9C3 NHS TaxID=3374295 RepID=UPI003879C804